MSKGIKKVAKLVIHSLLGVVFILILLLLTLALSFSLPRVQSFAASQLVEYLSERLDIRASVDGILISGLTRVEVEGLFVEDLEGDTLLYAPKVSAVVNGRELLTEKVLRPADIELENGSLRIVREGGKTNVDKLVEHVVDKLGLKSPGNQPPLTISGITLKNSRFRYFDPGDYVPQKSGVNYADMDIWIDYAQSNELIIEDGVVDINIDKLSMRDKSGAVIDSGSIGMLHIGLKELTFDDIYFEGVGSEVDVPRLAFDFDSWKDWDRFDTDVNMFLETKNSTLTSEGLIAFIPDFADLGITIVGLDGTYNGILADFWIDADAKIDGSTTLDLSGRVVDVMELKSARFDVERANVVSSSAELLGIYERIAGEPLKPEIAKLVEKFDNIDLALAGEGDMNTQEFGLTLRSNLGEVGAEGELALLGPKSFEFAGTVAAKEVALGEIASMADLGRLTAQAEGRLVVGRDYFDVENLVLGIDEIGFKGYQYRDITLKGGYLSEILKASLVSADPNMLLSLEGECDMSWFVPSYSFDLSIENANFAAVGLSGKQPVSALSCTIEATGEGGTLDELVGRAMINDLLYCSKADTLSTELINIVANNGEAGHSLSLYSLMANVEYRSKASYDDVIDYVSHKLVDKLPLIGGRQNLVAEQNDSVEKQKAEVIDDLATLSLNIKSDDNLLSVFVPGAKVAPDSSLRVEFSPSADRFEVLLDCNYLEMNDIFASDVIVDGLASGDSVELRGESEQLVVYDMSFPEATVGLSCSNAEDVSAAVSFDNHDANISARLALGGRLIRDEMGDIEADVAIGSNDDSFLMLDGQRWNIEAQRIAYAGKAVAVDSLNVSSADHYLFVDGQVGDKDSQELMVKINDVPLGRIVSVAAGVEGIDGNADGMLTLRAATSNPAGSGQLALTGMNFNGVDVDPLLLNIEKNSSSDVVRLGVANRDLNTTLAKLDYDFKRGDYDAAITINEVELSLFESLLTDYVSNLNGVAAVQLTVGGGSNRKLDIDGTIEVEQLATRINYTGVEYECEPLKLIFMNNRGVLEAFELRDRSGHSALLDGMLNLAGQEAEYQLHLMPNNLMLLDLPATTSNPFYGRIFASGMVQLSAVGNSTDITAALTTDDGSVFNLPLQGNNDFAGADFVQFVSFGQEQNNIVDERVVEVLNRDAQLPALRNTNVDAQLKVGTNTELRLIVDQATDNVLVARGEADMTISLDSRKEGMEIRGDYQISEGVFNLNFQNLVSRQFAINQGSFIRWNGNPMDATLDVSATYRLKTSLAPLLGNANGAVRSTTPVDCIVNLGGSLSAIDVSFDINVPTANSEYQSILSSYFSSQEMMATQFVYLLALGSFYSDDNSSNVGTSPTTAGAAIGFDFVANQLSRLISNDNLKVKLKYNALDDVSSSYGVDVSRGFLDDRLLFELDANLERGGIYEDAVGTQGQFTGGFSATAILDKLGNLSAKFFSRTIDRMDENQGLQETGIGVYYRKSFDKFRDLWRKKGDKAGANSEKSTTFVAPSEQSTVEADSTTVTPEGAAQESDNQPDGQTTQTNNK